MSVNAGVAEPAMSPPAACRVIFSWALFVLVPGVVEALLDDVDQDKSPGAGDCGFEPGVEHEPLIIPPVDGAAV